MYRAHSPEITPWVRYTGRFANKSTGTMIGQ